MLHDVRRGICIIPQEPSIFSGSIKRNLDPLNEFTEARCWDALKDAHLDADVHMMAQGLDSEASTAFSVGQKQLLCLARAVLRSPQILVLDEVTANVDIDTDHKIQETIRRKFSNCTQLAIAHRLSTVIDADKIMVMDQGVMAEFDHPHNLIQNKDGIFNALVNNDKENAESLKQLAADSYEVSPEAIALRLSDLSGEEREAMRAKLTAEAQSRVDANMEEFQDKQRKAKQAIVERSLAEPVHSEGKATRKDAIEDLSKLFTELDQDLKVHPNDEMARLKMEYLWKELEGLRHQMSASFIAHDGHHSVAATPSSMGGATPREVNREMNPNPFQFAGNAAFTTLNRVGLAQNGGLTNTQLVANSGEIGPGAESVARPGHTFTRAQLNQMNRANEGPRDRATSSESDANWPPRSRIHSAEVGLIPGQEAPVDGKTMI